MSSAGETDSIQRDGSTGSTGRDAPLRLEAGGMRAGRGAVVRHKESDYEGSMYLQDESCALHSRLLL